MTRPRLLWLTTEVPDRDLGGGSIRQYYLIRRMSQFADVDLIVVGELEDAELRARLHRVIEVPWPPESRSRPQWRRRVRNLVDLAPGGLPTDVRAAGAVRALLRPHLRDLSEYEVINVEHDALAPLLPQKRTNSWVLTLHNLSSVRGRQLATIARTRRVGWLLRRDASKAAAFERRIVDAYDLAIVVSNEDAAALGGNVAVVPNGVDLEHYRPSELPGDPVLLFSASFNWLPNVDAAVWLCNEVLPRIRVEVPGVKLQLVGRQPDRTVLGLCDLPNVEGHFDVPSIRPFLEAARLALVPIRVGSGTRLKALEAMAAGRPLVGTTIGLEGLGLVDGSSAAVADDPDALSAKIVRLCQDDEFARRLAANARQLGEACFGWDDIADTYVGRILALVSRPAAGSRSEFGR